MIAVDGTSTPVRGRLAPSPTGALHLGNARSFLLAWLSIRSRGGSVVLRMEDLDHPRVKPDAAAQALTDLTWLGLDWDEGPDCGGNFGPYVQSERIARYRDALVRLHEQRLVYPCTCSRREVEVVQSAPHAGEEGMFYGGFCRERFASYAAACSTLPDGRLPVWRFRTPDGTVTYDDGFHGRQAVSVAQTAGDFAVARHPDGAGYMLAAVVDDAAMGITEILRGEDLLPATPRQILLYRALGLQPPRFVHVPLVVAPDGRRLAKRHGDTRLCALRQGGHSAETILGLLGYWCGWCEWGEQITAQDLLPRYDLQALPPDPVVLDSRVKSYLKIR